MTGMQEAARKKQNAHLWVRDPDDWYIEPQWCDDALFAAEPFNGCIVDPCCGTGRILDAARRAGYQTYGFDIKDRKRNPAHAFILGNCFECDDVHDNIVSNPPYLYDDEFLKLALARSSFKTAVLLRAQWANAGTRSRWLQTLPLKRVLALSPRPSMPPGAVIMAGINPSGGKQDFSWFVFERGYTGKPEFGWAHKPARVKAQKELALS